MARDRPWTDTGLEILKEDDFEGTRLKRPGTHIVCFGAEWCPFTRRFIPRFVAAQDQLRGALAIADLTETKSPLWETFRIRIVPTLIVFREGEVLTRVDGKRFVGISAPALGDLASFLRPTGPS